MEEWNNDSRYSASFLIATSRNTPSQSYITYAHRGFLRSVDQHESLLHMHGEDIYVQSYVSLYSLSASFATADDARPPRLNSDSEWNAVVMSKLLYNTAEEEYQVLEKPPTVLELDTCVCAVNTETLCRPEYARSRNVSEKPIYFLRPWAKIIRALRIKRKRKQERQQFAHFLLHLYGAVPPGDCECCSKVAKSRLTKSFDKLARRIVVSFLIHLKYQRRRRTNSSV